MDGQPGYVKFFRDQLKEAHHIKIINITVVLDESNNLVHSHMEHPQPITRPVLISILEGMRLQVIQDYNALEKSASCIETAEKILSVVKVNQPMTVNQTSGVNQQGSEILKYKVNQKSAASNEHE